MDIYSKMKVLFIGSSNYEEGISSIVANQGKSLEDIGIDVEYFGIYGKGARGYLKNLSPLKKVIRKGNYDILHAHYGVSGLLTLMARKKETTVISYMGSDLIRLGKVSLKNKLIGIAEIFLNRFFARHSYDYIIVKSENMAARLPGISNMSIMPNGANLKLFHPVEMKRSREILGLETDARIILFASDPGRTEKNFQLAQKAVETLDFENVKMLPLVNINQDMMKYYYSAADLLLLTSLYEGSPNVVKEAMACNCPIVSTDVGDVKSIIDGCDGCYLAAFDSEDVKSQIHRALTFAAGGTRTAGRTKLQNDGLDAESIALKIRNIYKSLVQKDRKP